MSVLPIIVCGSSCPQGMDDDAKESCSLKAKGGDAVSILLLEDDTVDAKVFQRMAQEVFTSCTVMITLVTTCQEAIRVLRGGEYDIIVLDMHLPDGHELGVVRQVSPYTAASSVIALTGSPSEQLMIKAAEAGVEDFLSKDDLDPRSLQRVLHYALARIRRRRSLVSMAYKDTLTGLSNRRHMDEMLDSVIASAQRLRQSPGLLFLDVDRFKQINDTLGHLMGDAIFRALASALREELRDTDLLARMGGDEFVILLQDTTEPALMGMAERLVEACRVPIEVGDQKMMVTISVGVATWSDPTQTGADFLKAADQALYRAKGKGRDCASS